MTIFRVVVHDMTVWIAIILDTGRKLLIFPMLTKEESLVYVSHPTTVPVWERRQVADPFIIRVPIYTQNPHDQNL